MRESTAFKRNTLGFGLVCPMRRMASSDFVAAEGEALVRSCIMQILGTKPGELLWRPDFGTDLERFRHRAAHPALSKEIATQIAAALQTWEPRIQISRCSAVVEYSDGDVGNNIIRVRVDWAVVSGSTGAANNVLIGPVSQEVAL